MRKPTPLILLAIVAVLATIYLADRPNESPPPGSAIAPFVEPTAVRTVVLDRPDAEYVFEREGNAWRIRSPVEDRADAGEVNVLVQSICPGRVDRLLDDAVPDSRYGFAPDAAVVTLLGERGDTLARLRIGALTVDAAFAYASFRGKVALVPPIIRRAATRDAFHYRDKRIVRFDIASVVSYDLFADNDTVRWRRDASDAARWLSGGDAAGVVGDRSAVEAVLHRLRGLRADAIVDSCPIPRSRPAFVRIRTDDNIERTVRLLGSNGRRAWIESMGRIAVTDTAALAAFEGSVAAMRDRRLLHAPADGVGRIAVSAPGIDVVLIRPERDWVHANPAFGAPPPNAAIRFIGLLRALRARSVLSERRAAGGEGARAGDHFYDLSSPPLRVTIGDTSGRLADQLWFAPARGNEGGYVATSRSTGFLALVDSTDVEELIRAALALSPAGRRTGRSR